MPVHDWTRVSAGTFHDFHHAWITELRNALNGGLLPPEYYAQAEQVTGDFGPDVLTLLASRPDDSPTTARPDGALAVATAPPRVYQVFRSEAQIYSEKGNALVLRHSSDDRIIALIEIVSHGNKAGRKAFESFIEKAVTALAGGIHLLVIDLHPPTRRVPQGIHGAIWDELTGEPYTSPRDKQLTLVSYTGKVPNTAYVEPVEVGRALPDMPLFLDPEHYIPVPLESTYQAAWRGVPWRWREVLGASL